MGNKITILIIGIIALSCSSDDESVIKHPVLGSWTLESTITGDGSSISNTPYDEGALVYNFNEDGIITSSKSLCIFGPVGNPSSGTYDLENQTISTNCGGSVLLKSYELQENNSKLIFNGGCIETCVEVFVRLD